MDPNASLRSWKIYAVLGLPLVGGLTFWAWHIGHSVAYALCSAALAGLLVSLSIVDALTLRLPNLLTALLALAGFTECGWIEPDAIWDRIAGLIAGILVFVLLAVVYRRLRKREGLGIGDAKLLGGSGAWIGASGLPGVVFLSACFGLVWVLMRLVRDGKTAMAAPLPYGPFLAAATWIVWLYGPLLPSWR